MSTCLSHVLDDKLPKGRVMYIFFFIVQHGFLHQVGTWPVFKERRKEGRSVRKVGIMKNTVESQAGKNLSDHLISVPSVTILRCVN